MSAEGMPVWPDEMQRLLCLKIEKEGGQAKFIRKHGLNQHEISEMQRGVRPVSGRVASALGYEKRIVYVRPFLEEGP